MDVLSDGFWCERTSEAGLHIHNSLSHLYEVIHAYRELMTRAPQRIDNAAGHILRYVLNTVKHRIYLTVQLVQRLLDPEETSVAPHPLLVVVDGILGCGWPHNSSNVVKSMKPSSQLDLRCCHHSYQGHNVPLKHFVNAFPFHVSRHESLPNKYSSFPADPSTTGTLHPISTAK